jgi:hypothetical protein
MVSDGVRADAPHWLNREPQQVFRPLDLLVMWRLYMKYVVPMSAIMLAIPMYGGLLVAALWYLV